MEILAKILFFMFTSPLAEKCLKFGHKLPKLNNPSDVMFTHQEISIACNLGHPFAMHFIPWSLILQDSIFKLVKFLKFCPILTNDLKRLKKILNQSKIIKKYFSESFKHCFKLSSSILGHFVQSILKILNYKLINFGNNFFSFTLEIHH